MIANHSQSLPNGQSRFRLGAVSYLNARPLVAALERDPAVHLTLDVPAQLTPRLLAGEFDAALIPVVELARPDCALRVLSDACIASDGETLTVRVFSKVPPARIERMWLDTDSRTSVTLARVLWPGLYGRTVEFEPLPATDDPAAFDTVLLIGDKVVGINPDDFGYHIDLGGAWKAWTGLPLVFAVWAAPRTSNLPGLERLLCSARDAGIKRAGQLAVEFGPLRGWPVELAQQYLQRYMRYKIDAKYAEGMVRFLDLAAAHVSATTTAAGHGA